MVGGIASHTCTVSFVSRTLFLRTPQDSSHSVGAASETSSIREQVMAQDWQGKVALITGGTSGIGRAAAVAFGACGARVVVAGRSASAGEKTVAEVRATGAEALFVKTDVTRPDDVAALFGRISNVCGRLDFAFNNAGNEGQMAPTAECSQENWDRTIAVNLTAAYLCMKHEIPLMLEKRAGIIVNCASAAGLCGEPSLPAYTAAKHGLIGLTRAAALEYVQQGLRINAVCPGIIDTPMFDRVVQRAPEANERIATVQPIGRRGRPEEVVSAVMWLCSEGASFMVGHALAVDGGWTAR
jgi:NAD(P)-dependent dehydrogenase (short-subunit alcohol dehydrogenase family)